MNNFLNLRKVLWVMMGLYFLVVSFLAISRHRNFYSWRYDLGNMEQVVYNTTKGRIFKFTDPEGRETISRLKYHADFILILIAPFYKLFPYTETLLVIQTLVVALGALPLFLLAREVLESERLAVFISGAYLLYPALMKANLYDFHGVVLAVTFLLFSFWYLYRKNYIWFFVFSILAIICKEQIPIAVILMSWWGVRRDKKFRKKGLVFSLLTGIYFLVVFFILIPSFRETGSHFVFKHSFNWGFLKDKATYDFLTKLFFPLGFIPFLAPGYLVFGIFDLAGKIISGNVYYKSIDFHYTGGIIPFIFIAFVFGLKRYIKFLEKREIKVVYGMGAVGVFFGVGFYLWSVVTSGHLGVGVGDLLIKREEVFYIEKLKKKVSIKESVCATNNLGAQFAKRENLYMFPDFCEGADYILIYEGYADMVSGETVEKKVASLAKDERYKKVGEYKNFIGFEKIK